MSESKEQNKDWRRQLKSFANKQDGSSHSDDTMCCGKSDGGSCCIEEPWLYEFIEDQRRGVCQEMIEYLAAKTEKDHIWEVYDLLEAAKEFLKTL